MVYILPSSVLFLGNLYPIQTLGFTVLHYQSVNLYFLHYFRGAILLQKLIFYGFVF